MSLYFALQTVKNNKNKKSVKFQGDTLIFCDFIKVFVFNTDHHLNVLLFCYVSQKHFSLTRHTRFIFQNDDCTT